MSTRQILISGYYGFGNVGDEAVLESMVAGFRSKIPEVEIAVLSASAQLTAELNQVKAIHRYHWLKIIRAIFQTDIFISGGGTLFQDVTSKHSFYYYLSLVLLAKLFCKKVVIFAQGFGPLRSPINRLMAKVILNWVDLITVRDEDSYQSLLNLGIKSSLLHLTADPSVILKVSPWEGQKILSLEGIPSGKPLLGISVRSIPGRPDLEKKIFEVLAKVVDYLEENYNYQPVFLPFECPEDLGEAKKVMDLMKGNPKIIFRICRPSEMLAVISQMDLLIGMRLHSLIFAAKSKVAFLGISYDPKVKAFAKTFGLPFLEVEPEFNFETIREKIAKIICEKDSIKELLASKMDIIYHLAEENFELLAKLIALEK